MPFVVVWLLVIAANIDQTPPVALKPCQPCHPPRNVAPLPPTLTHAGVNVSDLLSRFGLQVNQTSEQVGTFAIAYAAHKALSPVRFPPTVALTPVVAKWIGKDKKGGEEGSGSSSSGK